MLKNYKKLSNGIIKQIKVNKINYNKDYINKSYDSYGDLVSKMSHLRFGYLMGTVKRVPESILDIGYGNGDFLKTCKSQIKKCYGNDVSGYELPKGIESVDDIKNGFYDVITFFDSLEHFDDISFIKDLNCNYIMISVPWCHYISDEWFDCWKHRRENEHIYHFNEKSLKNFMEENGYKLVVYSNIEDTIRKSKDEKENILTAIFKKK